MRCDLGDRAEVFTDYDRLRVVDILPLLKDLDDTELGAIERRERDGKGRAMVLNRIARLRTAAVVDLTGPAPVRAFRWEGAAWDDQPGPASPRDRSRSGRRFGFAAAAAGAVLIAAGGYLQLHAPAHPPAPARPPAVASAP